MMLGYYDPDDGDNLDLVITRMIEKADQAGKPVYTQLNGFGIMANPGDTFERLIDHYLPLQEARMVRLQAFYD